ncbi:MAG: YdeI/OmpD-associated family protein, partial [Acidobacteriota bacterium]
LMPAGLKRASTARSGDAPRPSDSVVPDYIEHALRARKAAWNHFAGLAPSYRRMYIAWIEAAKQQETKRRRLQEAISLLAAGKKLGLK